MDGFEELAEMAVSGDVDTAKTLLELFVSASRDGMEPHPTITAYIALCVARVLDGKSAEQAFNLAAPSNRPASGKSVAIAVEMAKRIPRDEDWKAPRGAVKAASEVVSRMYSVEEETVLKYYRQNELLAHVIASYDE